MTYKETLYKTDSKNRLRVWKITTIDADVIQHSGLMNGKMVENIHTCSAKNVGRSNETTPEEQAVLEAKSKVAAKLDEGYFETIEEAKNVKVVLPMLAKSYDKEAKKVDWDNCYVQPKLDGMRALKQNSRLFSRKGKSIDTLPHISNEIIAQDVYIDGELYAHGLNFQENMRLIKKQRDESINVKYHVYDMISDKPFQDRFAELGGIVDDCEHIELVPTMQVASFDAVKEAYAQFTEEGYEGIMIRWGKTEYHINKRSSNLLKYKEFIDVSLPILDVYPSDKRPDQGCFAFYWEGAKGHFLGDDILGSGMKFSHEERSEFLTNKQDYIGKTAEVRFFEYSEDGVPRFPVTVGLRLDK